MSEDYGDRLERHEARLAALEGFTEQLRINNERLMGMQLDLSAAVGRIEGHMASIETRMVSIDTRLASMDARLERVEGLLDRMLPGSANGHEG